MTRNSPAAHSQHDTQFPCGNLCNFSLYEFPLHSLRTAWVNRAWLQRAVAWRGVRPPALWCSSPACCRLLLAAGGSGAKSAGCLHERPWSAARPAPDPRPAAATHASHQSGWSHSTTQHTHVHRGRGVSNQPNCSSAGCFVQCYSYVR